MEAVATSFSDDPGWSLRVDLALCYRVVAHYGLTDQIYTHISARVPGAEDRFLLNRMGVGFDEMTASDLVEVGEANWLVDPAALAGREIQVKLRSTSPAAAARVIAKPDGGGEILLRDPQFGVSPGQAVVFYDGSHVLGGGWIRSTALSTQAANAA